MLNRLSEQVLCVVHVAFHKNPNDDYNGLLIRGATIT